MIGKASAFLRRSTGLLLLLAVLAVALPMLLKGDGPTPGLAQQPGFTACPPARGWVNAVWMGANNTPTGQALAACSGADLAFSFDPAQGWTWFIPGAPGNTLADVDNLQPLWLHGGAAGPTPTPTPSPTPTPTPQPCVTPPPGMVT